MTTRQHGTRSMYVGGCRCEPCRAANAADKRTRRVASPLVPVGPIVEHLRALQAAGVGRRRIARAARIAESTLDRIAREPNSRMVGECARRVLAVRLAEIEP